MMKNRDSRMAMEWLWKSDRSQHRHKGLTVVLLLQPCFHVQIHSKNIYQGKIGYLIRPRLILLPF